MGYLLIKVGRGTENDVVIQDPSVSLQHLEIFVDVEGNVFLTDMDSESGTMVNGTRISDSVELNASDVVTIGSNIQLDWKSYIARDEKNTITVGRANTNDVVIDAPYVSEKHLQLFRDVSGNIFITDLDSASGTFINGIKLNGIALLDPSDTVRVGREVFRWRLLYPDLKDVESPRESTPEPMAEPTPETEPEKPKLPWYKEHKDLIIIYGIDLLLILLISWQLS